MPLADTLRPASLDQFVGQQHLVGRNKPIHQMISTGQVFPCILWGPPGVGKTTLARIMAQSAERQFYALSAVSAGKAQVREIIEEIQRTPLLQTKPPILFLDEIHRFNKAQQDFLLPYVERGSLVLIGATTENPSFEVNRALLSRMKVFVLQSLTESELDQIISAALTQYQSLHPKLSIAKQARAYLLKYASGDARQLLNLIESTVELYQSLSLSQLKEAAQSQIAYDKKGEEHYNTISAFIKSMRASNTDAALYYLARMVEGGEDPKFIARRMVVFASEDIGLAQPTALVVANAVLTAVEKVGYPEAQINLAHGAAYLAQAKKNRSAYDAYFAALADVKKHGSLPIPLHLRNAPTKLMRELDYGRGYEMYPDPTKSLLPDTLSKKKYLK